MGEGEADEKILALVEELLEHIGHQAGKTGWRDTGIIGGLEEFFEHDEGAVGDDAGPALQILRPEPDDILDFAEALVAGGRLEDVAPEGFAAALGGGMIDKGENTCAPVGGKDGEISEGGFIVLHGCGGRAALFAGNLFNLAETLPGALWYGGLPFWFLWEVGSGFCVVYQSFRCF